MPASHDLYQDLDCSKEAVQQRRQQDPELDRLLDDYTDVDNQVLAAESISAGNVEDDDIRKLKEQRLRIKDQITQKLTDTQ